MFTFNITNHYEGLGEKQYRQLVTLIQEVKGTQQTIIVKGDNVLKELDDLTAQVKANTTVIGSALTLIQGFQEKLDAAIAAGPAALNALSAELKQNDDALSAAVAANTPAASEG